MKRRFVVLAAAFTTVLALMLLLPRGSAQNAARANVPFAFTANHQTLPAGCYSLTLQSHGYLVLTNCATGKMVGLMVRTTNAYRKVDHASLVFFNTGHRYWLTDVRFAHTNMESRLAAQPKSEPELAKDLAASRVEVAMK